MAKHRFFVLLAVASLYSFNFVSAAARFSSPAFVTTSATIFPSKRKMQSDGGNDDDTRDFHDLASAAVDLSNAHVSKSGIFTVQRSVRDWDKDRRRAFLYQMTLNDDSQQQEQQPPTLLDESIKIRLASPSGKHLLVVHSDDNRQCLEFWQDASLVRRVFIPSSLHGSIINDKTGFGVPTWSPDESYIVYVAERSPPKTKSFWSKEEDSSGNEVLNGGKQVLGQGTAEEWGEQYAKQTPLLDLFVLHVGTGKVERVTNVPQGKTDDQIKNTSLGGVTLGQPVWHPSLSKIAYTGWDAGGLGRMPRRLGMVYCRNRPSSIYISDISKLLQRVANPEDGGKDEKDEDKEYECKTVEFPYARSPRYITAMDGSSRLLFLANSNEFVSHEGCMALYQYLGDDKDVDCIIPVVDVPKADGPKVEGLGFPGLFLHQLPATVSLDENYLILETTWGSVTRIIRTHLETKQVQVVELPTEKNGNDDTVNQLSSHSLLCQTPSGDLLVSEAATNRPARIWLIPQQGLLADTQESSIYSQNAKVIVDFSPIAASAYSSVQPKYSTMPFDVHLLSVGTKDGSSTIQAILCLPHHLKKQRGSSVTYHAETGIPYYSGVEKKVPLIVIPHGGPHSCTISSYAPGFAFLASHYAVVFPNYRGSTGFGQTALESLLTTIGENDVQDVMAMTQLVVSQFKDVIDENNIGICGGSHGGFLTAHCTGQYPDYFKAAVMRNPVTNIASMVTATDIPDWCHAESVGTYDFSKFQGPTLDEMSTMYEKSPIVHVTKVKTPTLVALGMKDLRVPPSQGLEWYHTLRSAGVDTELLVYPEDNHALNKVATEADHWIHIKKWFDKYLQ